MKSEQQIRDHIEWINKTLVKNIDKDGNEPHEIDSISKLAEAKSIALLALAHIEIEHQRELHLHATQSHIQQQMQKRKIPESLMLRENVVEPVWDGNYK